MKKLLFITAALLTWLPRIQSHPGYVCSPYQGVSFDTTTVIRWQTHNIDMGYVWSGSSKTVEFPYTNTGARPVSIIKVYTTCGCTVPEYTKGPLAPGKTGIVKITYRASDLGHFDKTINVSTDINEPGILLIHGTVIPKGNDTTHQKN